MSPPGPCRTRLPIGTKVRPIQTASGTPPGSTPLSPPRAETEHPVPAPGFEIDKTADPVGGSIVRPGQSITYTVSGANTGGTVLDPVVITDDLDRVLGHADYNRDAKAVIGDRDVSDGIRYDAAAETISWTGALEPGESVQLVYSVTVKAGASTGMIENRVSGSATPPGNDPLTPPDKQVVHRVGVALATTGLAGGDMAVIIGFSMLMILTGAAIAVRVRRRQEV
ncbi:isopeptide-forming domain-containing fimbrial protein [Microbacterium sp. GXF6406]